MKEDKQLDAYIKSRVEELDGLAPPGWDAAQSWEKLSVSQAPTLVRPIYWRRIAAAVLLLCTIYIWHLYNPEDTPNPSPVLVDVKEKSEEKTKTISDIPEPLNNDSRADNFKIKTAVPPKPIRTKDQTKALAKTEAKQQPNSQNTQALEDSVAIHSVLLAKSEEEIDQGGIENTSLIEEVLENKADSIVQAKSIEKPFRRRPVVRFHAYTQSNEIDFTQNLKLKKRKIKTLANKRKKPMQQQSLAIQLKKKKP